MFYTKGKSRYHQIIDFNLIGGLMMKKIGFIGIGTMGSRMAAQVMKAGYPVYVYDILQEPMAAAEAFGAAACESPADVARKTDIFITMVRNSREVEEVVFGENGILEGAHAGHIYIDMCSSEPGSTKKIAAVMEERGIRMLDAPVSGGPIGAENGTLSILVGGEEAVMEEVLPLLRAMGAPEKIIHVGGHGAGHTAKAVNNILFGTTLAATCEAIELGVKAGVPTELMVKVISSSSGNSYSINKLNNYVLAGKVNGGFSIALLNKDMGIADHLAEEEHVEMPVCRTAREYYREGIERGWSLLDNSKILTLFEEAGGIEIRL